MADGSDSLETLAAALRTALMLSHVVAFSSLCALHAYQRAQKDASWLSHLCHDALQIDA